MGTSPDSVSEAESGCVRGWLVPGSLEPTPAALP
jgi:hypothetical protein